MYSSNSGANSYKETRIKTASQARLIVMLYDEALKQIHNVIELFDHGVSISDYDKINNALNKALDIIGELSASLDFENGGDISPNLFNLYQFFNAEITNANLKKEVENLPQVYKLISELREAWNIIDANKPDPNQRSFNIAG